jgi:4'-phosphopantetheinyl transferase EntD
MVRLPPDIAFDLHLEHGRCVGIRLPAAAESIDALAEQALLPEERAFASKLLALRRRSWVGGRVAMRQALMLAGVDTPAVLPDARGAPILPEGVVGSVSHKDALAVALIDKGTKRVGVDVEHDRVSRQDISSRVLTASEEAELAPLAEAPRAREVLLRFSAKEAIYKAIDPFVRRYVDFKEVSVRPLAGGGAEVRSHLPPNEGPFVIEVRWLRWEGFVLTTARAGKADV